MSQHRISSAGLTAEVPILPSQLQTECVFALFLRSSDLRLPQGSILSSFLLNLQEGRKNPFSFFPLSLKPSTVCKIPPSSINHLLSSPRSSHKLPNSQPSLPFATPQGKPFPLLSSSILETFTLHQPPKWSPRSSSLPLLLALPLLA